ncbi:MAG: carotenoid 1,2-hydratase [Gammaproteobacteria bacterium]|nr:carotenoid 1,2-hydratase [Gammaproteobacteria bacterium]
MNHYAQFLKVLTTLLLVPFICWGCSQPSSSSDLSAWMGSNFNIEAFAQVDGTYALSFPLDHGPHDKFLFEWWYVTAILDDHDGREFGVQFTIFRRTLATGNDSSNLWRTGQVYMGHFAVSDIQTETHRSNERFSRGHPELAGAQIEPFRVFIEDWKLVSQSSSFFPLELSARTPDYRIKLSINRGKPMILHGKNGYSQKSPDHASYYYSFSRLPTNGTLEIEGEKYTVSGFSWLDREWSSQILSEPYRGWYWFSLNFEDGRDLVLFELHADDNNIKTLRTGMWIEPEGSTVLIPAEGWSITPSRYWKSYPVEWILEIDDIRYLIAAKFDDQVMDASIRYWEGVVEITDAGAVVGRGYMELTGYE